MPVEHFLLEPPRLLDNEGLGLTPIGVSLLQVGETWHVVDWVGAQHYPNVADFVEEVRHMGLLRRLPKTLDFSKLTPQSRIVLLHARAHVDNWKEYENTDDFTCPKLSGYPQKHPDGMCIATWWHDVDDAVPAKKVDGVWTSHVAVTRGMPSFDYRGYARPEDVKPAYKVAAFASFPITRLEVINDAEGKTHVPAVEAARKATLPVSVEEA
jgi:hypothetical protein